MSEQPSAVRNIFFYLIALVALGFIVGSSVYVLNYLGKVTVFTKGEYTSRGTPPGLYLIGTKESPDAGLTKVTCTDTCSLTDTDRTAINDWQNSYKEWQNQPTTSVSKKRGLVNALSFLVVAIPIFIFFFRTVQKDFRNETSQGIMQKGSTIPRSIYFYFIVLAAVVMFIISAGATINTSLKTWVIKDTATESNLAVPTKLGGAATSETEGVDTLLACAEKCAISAEQKTVLTQWQNDYADAKTELDEQNTNAWQRTLAMSIPFLLVSIPLFWLHWAVIQRERKKITQ